MKSHRVYLPRIAALPAILCCGLLASFSTARAVPLSPTLKLMPISTFTGVIDSIPVPSDEDVVIETGPISLALDTTAYNVFGLDDVQKKGYIDVTLILSSPLLDFLGESPKIRIVESGPAWVYQVNQPAPGPAASQSIDGYCDCDCFPFDFYFFAALTGGGTVQDGIFAGTTFENINAYQGTGLNGSWIVRPNSIVTWDISDTAVITFPDGTRVEGVSGIGTLTVVPEPTSLALAGMALAGLVLAARGRTRRR